MLHDWIKYALVVLPWLRYAVHSFHREVGKRDSEHVSSSHFDDPDEDLTFTCEDQYQEAFGLIHDHIRNSVKYRTWL